MASIDIVLFSAGGSKQSPFFHELFTIFVLQSTAAAAFERILISKPTLAVSRKVHHHGTTTIYAFFTTLGESLFPQTSSSEPQGRAGRLYYRTERKALLVAGR